MARMETPVCDFGQAAVDFDLPGTDGRNWALADCRGPNGLLVMFICNHCPYVKAIRDRLIRDVAGLRGHGIGAVAISANDTVQFPEDDFEHMQALATELELPFPYLFDESQAVARDYGAVCTPDFFGYNAALELQYRGRLDASGREPGPTDARRELFEGMVQVAESGRGPERQTPSMGCSIKWREGG